MSAQQPIRTPVKHFHERGQTFAILDAHGHLVGRVTGFPETISIIDAINANGDMLAALKEVAEYMGEPVKPSYPNPQAAVVNALIRNVHIAIAKAEGRV